MAHRIIAQVVIVGTQVFGKAFISAWKQAAANSAQVASSSGPATKDAITRTTGLTVEEACQILNLKKDNVKLEDVIARHKVMFEGNDPKSGGSFYIQSKVFRAKERLEMELSIKAAGESAPAEGSSTNAGSGPNAGSSSNTTPPP